MKFSSLIIFLLGVLSVHSFAQVRKTTTKAPVVGLQLQMAAGKKVYTMYCLTCHQADGGGVTNMNPPLIKTTYVFGDKNRIIKIVLKGLTEPIDIDGDTYTNVMPPLAHLTDKEVADVLTYVRNSFGNKAAAVTVAEVKKVRAGLK